jgi:transposase
VKEVKVMDWPGNSPDLNPIENVWNFMKNKLKKKTITSVTALKEEIMKLLVLETKYKAEMTKY